MYRTAIILLMYLIPVSSDNTPRAKGCTVVQQAIAKITSYNLGLPDDHGFLMNAACQESLYGTYPGTFQHYGGIWQVDREKFQETKNVVVHRKLARVIQGIYEESGWNWENVEWFELEKPVLSALAARLVMFLWLDTIPADLSSQAKVWKRLYNASIVGSTEESFINNVNNECPKLCHR